MIRSLKTIDLRCRLQFGFTRKWSTNIGSFITLALLMVLCPLMEPRAGLKMLISKSLKLKGLGVQMETSQDISLNMPTVTSCSQLSITQAIWLLNGRDLKCRDSLPSLSMSKTLTDEIAYRFIL